LIAVWALVAGISMRPPYHGWQSSDTGIVDERSFELITYAGVSDLTTTDSRPKNTYGLTTPAGVNGGGQRILVLGSGEDTRGPRWTIPLSPSVPDNSAFFNDNMGIAAIVMPLDGTVVDLHGLATPLGGHLLLEGRGRVGHEKFLTAAWVLGEYADPAAIATMRDNNDVTKAQALAARRALSCGAAKELMESVDQPMSWNRFWKNLIGAPSRTQLRIPVEPFVAERQFCGP
jgi:arabinofuranosyltransferase